MNFARALALTPAAELMMSLMGEPINIRETPPTRRPGGGNRKHNHKARSHARWGKKKQPYAMLSGYTRMAPRPRAEGRYAWP